MLIYPSIDNLLEKIDSKYTLATLSAQRAHQIEDKNHKEHRKLLDEYKSISYVGKALEEIASGDLVIDPESIDKDHL